MTLTQNVDPEVYSRLTVDNITRINEYIDNPMTATRINGDKRKDPNKEQFTSELFYYWMIALQIPVEFQKWHLNRLITLIQVCSIKNSPPNKRSKAEIAKSYAEINAKRRQQMNTKG